jgi:hypothetical protein
VFECWCSHEENGILPFFIDANAYYIMVFGTFCKNEFVLVDLANITYIKNQTLNFMK